MRRHLALSLAVLVGCSLGGARGQEVVKPVVEWVGTVSDRGLAQQAPAGGAITNTTDLNALWRAWRGSEAPPRIDLDNYLVVVAISPDLRIIRLELKRDDTGNLTVTRYIEKDTPRGFSYGLAVIPRRGINSIEGRPLGGATTGEGGTVLRGHKSTVWSVAFTPDSQILASASFDRTVRLWDVARKMELAALEHPEWMISVAISPDGKLLAAGDLNGKVYLWDLGTRKKLAVLSKHRDRVRSLAFTPDSKTLASGSWDQTVILWDVDSARDRATIVINNAAINSIAISPDGKTGASVSIGTGSGNILNLWDIANGRVVEALKPSGTFVAFSPDGKTLAGSHVIWDWIRPAKLRELTLPAGHRINTVTYSPRGNLLLTGGEDHAIRIWNPETGQEVAVLKGHDKPVECVTVSPDGKLVASASLDQTVRLWPLPGKNGAP